MQSTLKRLAIALPILVGIAVLSLLAHSTKHDVRAANLSAALLFTDDDDSGGSGSGVTPCVGPPASVVDLGGGCGGPAPILSASNPPVLGSSLTLSVSSQHPNSPLFILATYGPPAPLPIPGLPCVIQVDVANFVILLSTMTDEHGDFSITTHIPNMQQLAGWELTLQARTWFPGGPIPEGDHLSNGLFFTFGCPNGSPITPGGDDDDSGGSTTGSDDDDSGGSTTGSDDDDSGGSTTGSDDDDSGGSTTGSDDDDSGGSTGGTHPPTGGDDDDS